MASEPGGLTQCKREIATLAARGMSNKEIVGFTARTQVGSWLAELERRPR